MRNISFALTEPQFLARTKTVTRRRGWIFLKPGDRLMGVRKAMGLKKGEAIVHLGPIEVVDVRREPLMRITPEDVIAEGFPDWTPRQFVDFYVTASKGKTLPADDVTRIAYRYLTDEEWCRDLPPRLHPTWCDCAGCGGRVAPP